MKSYAVTTYAKYDTRLYWYDTKDEAVAGAERLQKSRKSPVVVISKMWENSRERHYSVIYATQNADELKGVEYTFRLHGKNNKW